jgi:hypothetical protein
MRDDLHAMSARKALDVMQQLAQCHNQSAQPTMAKAT